MENIDSSSVPPITRLRPLHCRQQPSNEERKVQSSGTRNHFQNGFQTLQWSSSLASIPSKHTCIKAFVKLVSRIVILDSGEAFCIYDAVRGGYVLAHLVSASQEVTEADFEDAPLSFIENANIENIPTDFSIGEGKVS